MDGSAADDIKSLKLLVKELSYQLAASRDEENKLDDLMSTIANDAGINYEEFIKHQRTKTKDYFHINKSSKIGGARISVDPLPSLKDFSDLPQIDQEIVKLQTENLKMEQQIQRKEFLITKYLPILEREEDIMRGLHEFLKEKQSQREHGEKILERGHLNELNVINSRIIELKIKNLKQDENFVQLEKMYNAIEKVIKYDLERDEKILSKNQAAVKSDIVKLMQNLKLNFNIEPKDTENGSKNAA